MFLFALLIEYAFAACNDDGDTLVCTNSAGYFGIEDLETQLTGKKALKIIVSPGEDLNCIIGGNCDNFISIEEITIISNVEELSIFYAFGSEQNIKRFNILSGTNPPGKLIISDSFIGDDSKQSPQVELTISNFGDVKIQDSFGLYDLRSFNIKAADSVIIDAHEVNGVIFPIQPYESINIESKSVTIGRYAFKSSEVKTLNIKASDKLEIGPNAFLDCSKLDYVKLSGATVAISENALACTSLTKNGLSITTENFDKDKCYLGCDTKCADGTTSNDNIGEIDTSGNSSGDSGGDNSDNKNNKKKLSGGAIAGIVIACIVVVAGITVAVIFILKKNGKIKIGNS